MSAVIGVPGAGKPGVKAAAVGVPGTCEPDPKGESWGAGWGCKAGGCAAGAAC